MITPRTLLAFASLVSVALVGPLASQEEGDEPEREERRSLDLTIDGYGISIGDSRGVNGLRLNYRDTRLRRVNGANITVWLPHEESEGEVNGVALGLPATGAERINGIAAGILGAGAG
ncbi:MAG TPA: hypothetical protein VJ596_12630, partial [Gemmatimonadaceae bacterium]|nr:hypothetical protein [Gemmatimonadaceae bacterium]